jgi:hypothetical protein
MKTNIGSNKHGAAQTVSFLRPQVWAVLYHNGPANASTKSPFFKDYKYRKKRPVPVQNSSTKDLELDKKADCW